MNRRKTESYQGTETETSRPQDESAREPEAAKEEQGPQEAKEQDKDKDMEKLKADLSSAQAEAAETYDRLLRLSAEFENYKKRVQRQVEDHRKYANENLIKDLLSVVDNLERALNASKEHGQEADACMAEGIEMTLKEILKILKNYHVTPVEAVGKPFDPTYHEAVMQQETDEYPEGTVIEEMQKGYLLHDRLIRPAMVVVSKAAS